MEKTKRNDRMAAMAQVLTSSPNRIFTLSRFCDMFGAAKSTISEDAALLSAALTEFKLGSLETVTGAAGGILYKPNWGSKVARPFIENICGQLCARDRVLPGGYLYFSDILSNPELVTGMGNILAREYYGADVDFVLTMETKGIPVALMTASALNVPLIIARRSTKVYEGSAVNISYVSGRGGIETMSLSRRAVRQGQRALIVDDFMRCGGTAKGMLSLMEEFLVEVAGLCFVLSLENPPTRYVADAKSLMLLSFAPDGENAVVRPAEWLL